jgi:hypothetical protein
MAIVTRLRRTRLFSIRTESSRLARRNYTHLSIAITENMLKILTGLRFGPSGLYFAIRAI